MANYRGHVSFNLFLAFPIAIIAVSYFFSVNEKDLLIFSCTFIYGTLYMNPDLDLAHSIKVFSLRGFLALPFIPYSFICRHRGISHSFILGTITRVMWLILFGITIFYLYYKAPPRLAPLINFARTYDTELYFAFAGLFCADVSHLVLDRKIW